jgi:hypothetical protein
MADPNGMNGWVRRAQILGAIWDKIGTTPLVLAVIIGLALGWIPFKPLDDLARLLRAHDDAMSATIRNRENSESKSVIILDRLSLTLTRMEKRSQIIECSRLTDLDLRRRCLE